MKKLIILAFFILFSTLLVTGSHTNGYALFEIAQGINATNITLHGFGITFPDGTTQTTSSNASSSGWLNGGSLVTLVTTSDLVGIGTTTPTAKLEVFGAVNFSASLNVTGNITTELIGLPVHIFTHTNETVVVIQNIWTNVTFSHEVEDIKHGITHTFSDATNDTFTINEPGLYEVSYAYDIADSAASPAAHVAGRMINNNVEVSGSVREIDTTKQNAEQELSQPFLVRFARGDVTKFQIISSDTTVSIMTDQTFGDDPDSASIIFRRLHK